MMAVRGTDPEGVMSTTTAQRQALEVVREQITAAIRAELGPLLAEASRVLKPTQYDCLGCAVCYLAVTANAVADAYPDAAEHLAACPTEIPGERLGWPPRAGDYHVTRYAAPVAVCTLSTGKSDRGLT